MAVFTLATVGNTYEIIMFPESFEKSGSRLEEGKLALIHGQINRRNGEVGLTAHEVFDLEQSIPRIIKTINFILYPHRKNAAHFIETLRQTIDNEYGTTGVRISFLIDNQIAETETARSLTITITGENYKTLRCHPALAGVRIESIPVQTIDSRRPWEREKKKSLASP